MKFSNLLKSIGFFFLNINTVFSFIDYNYTSRLITIRNPLLPIFTTENDFYNVSFSIKNIWSLQYEKFIIDGEELEVKLWKNLKFYRKWNSGFFLTYKLQSGGFLDSTIGRFHKIFGIRQQHRDQFPRNKIQISYEPYGEFYQFYDDTQYTKNLRRKLRIYPRSGFFPPLFLPLDFVLTPHVSYFYLNNNLFPLELIPKKGNYDGMDNPEYYFQYKVYQDSKTKTFVGIRNKIPIIKNKYNYFYSAGIDTSLYISGSYLFLKNYEFLYGISYTNFEFHKWEWIQMLDHQWSLRFQWNIYNKNNIYFIEYLFMSRQILNIGRLSEDSHYLSFGIKKIIENKLITFSIIENFYLYATSPDFGIYFSIQINNNNYL